MKEAVTEGRTEGRTEGTERRTDERTTLFSSFRLLKDPPPASLSLPPIFTFVRSSFLSASDAIETRVCSFLYYSSMVSQC